MRETYAAVFLARFGGMLIKTSREYVKYFVITDSGSCYAGTKQRRFIASLRLTTAFFVDHESSMCLRQVYRLQTKQTEKNINVRLSNRRVSMMKSFRDEISRTELYLFQLNIFLKQRQQDLQNLNLDFHKLLWEYLSGNFLRNKYKENCILILNILNIFICIFLNLIYIYI